MSRLILLTTISLFRFATSTCPVIDHHKIVDNVAPCSVCTANNFVDGNQEVCGYCYATKTCHEITPLNMLVGPCPAPPSTPSPVPQDDDGTTTTDPTYDYSLGLNGECDCRPEKYTNCSTCASMQHLGCTWVTQGQQFREYKVPVFGESLTYNQDSWLNNSCQSVLSPEVKHYELLNKKGNVVFTLNTYTEVTEYFWGQCSLSNAGFGLLMSGLFVLCLAVGFGACVGFMGFAACCGYRKKRISRQPLYYAAPHTRLIDATGNPVVVVARSAGRFA